MIGYVNPLLQFTTNTMRPDMFISDSEKGDQYSINFATYCLSMANVELHNEYLNEIWTNKQFYKGNQWISEEDISNFLTDQRGYDSNKLKVVLNYILPMVEQFRGKLENSTFKFNAESLSPMVRDRKEQAYANLMVYDDYARANPQIAPVLKKMYGVHGDEEKTTKDFETFYEDKTIKHLNELMRWNAYSVNDIEKYKSPLGYDIMTAGIGILYPSISGGHGIIERIPPECFGWDRNCIEKDLSDSSFFWHVSYIAPTTVFKDNFLTDKEKKEFDTYLKVNNISYYNNNTPEMNTRIPQFTVFWRDIVNDKWGYVKNKFEEIVLERIDFIYENESQPRYKETDLIPLSELNEYQKNVLKSRHSNKNFMYDETDQWRFCTFIPNQALFGSISQKNSLGKVLKYGVVAYQEQDRFSPNNMRCPYFVDTWNYVDGEVLNPLTPVINPQRMINRAASTIEYRMNNAGGTNVAYDPDFTDMSEDEFRIAIKKGDPVRIKSKGMGIPNVMNSYNAGLDRSLSIYVELTSMFQTQMENISGINKAIKGEQQSANQLNGVTQMMQQNANLIQAPAMKAIENIYKRYFQHCATSFKRMYCDNQTQLIIATGNEGGQLITLSRDVKLEDFRIIFELTMSSKAERQMVDARLDAWLTGGIISKNIYAKYFGKATSDELGSILQEQVVQENILQQKQAEQMQQDRQQQLQLQTQMMDAQHNATKDLEMNKQQLDTQKKAMIQHLKNEGKNQSEKNKAMTDFLFKK